MSLRVPMLAKLDANGSACCEAPETGTRMAPGGGWGSVHGGGGEREVRGVDSGCHTQELLDSSLTLPNEARRLEKAPS